MNADFTAMVSSSVGLQQCLEDVLPNLADSAEVAYDACSLILSGSCHWHGRHDDVEATRRGRLRCGLVLRG